MPVLYMNDRTLFCSVSFFVFFRFFSGTAGTTKCFALAREYLNDFQTPIDLVTGNHDLEGLEEFATDRDNLLAFQVSSLMFLFFLCL